MIFDSITSSQIVYFVITPVVIAIGSKIIGGLMSRISALEAQHDDKIDREHARQMIEDKIGPMKDDLMFIRDRIVSLTDRLLDGK